MCLRVYPEHIYIRLRSTTNKFVKFQWIVCVKEFLAVLVYGEGAELFPEVQANF